jgi:hypothetical protein
MGWTAPAAASSCQDEVGDRNTPSRALVQIAVTSKNASLFTVETSSPKHRVPDLRRSLALNAQTSQSELSLADALQ